MNNAGVFSKEKWRLMSDVMATGATIGTMLAFQRWSLELGFRFCLLIIFLRMGVSQGGRGGTVVQTSSICGLWSGVMPQDGHVEHVYTAAKFGLIGLTRHG